MELQVATDSECPIDVNDKAESQPKITVEVRVDILKISSVNTLKEQFTADVLVQWRWPEPLLDYKSIDELESVDIDNFWSPKLTLENLNSGLRESSWHQVELNQNGNAYITKFHQICAIFVEPFELEQYPFDVQELSVIVKSQRPLSEVDLVPFTDKPSSLNRKAFGGFHEWKVYHHLEVTQQSVSSGLKETHPAVKFTSRVQRRSTYFFFNVYLILFLITGVSLANYSSECAVAHSKIQPSVTVLLTSITYKWVINKNFPKVSYLTYLDKYVILTWTILVMISLWNSVVATVCQQDSFGADHLLFYDYKTTIGVTLIATYLILHISYFAFIVYKVTKNTKKLKKKDNEYKLKLAAHRNPSGDFKYYDLPVKDDK